VIVVFLGPPGSGKGTQAALLEDRLGFYHFDTGARLRQETTSGSDLGKRIATFINHGQLVPLDVIDELLRQFFSTSDAQNVLFDGFPRNMEQAAVLERGLKFAGRSLDHVIFFDIDMDLLLARIVNRRVCAKCGAIYNMQSEPPRITGVCDVCGAELSQRQDDTEEVFGTRLRVYTNNTTPLLDYYGQLGLLRTVDADQGVDTVFSNIESLIGGAGSSAKS
jgi:adenylate kinase